MMWQRRTFVVGLVLALVLLSDAFPALADDSGTEAARIVVLARDTSIQQLGRTNRTQSLAQDRTTKTVAAQLTDREVRELQADPDVISVENDGPVQMAGITERKPPWGLDRIDQRRTELNNRYRPSETGRGVDVFVVDSGLTPGHPDFGSTGEGYVWPETGDTTEDCNGHGTHVTGILASQRFGAAPGVRIHPVRVLDCQGSGTYRGVLAGLQWVREHMTRRSVVTLSLTGDGSSALDRGVRELVAAGAVVVTAAGNAGGDACDYSPARVSEALTVGATTRRGEYWDVSNGGSCVDISAPGVGIVSTDWRSATGAKKESGTSMAVPHVAAASAIYWALHKGRSGPRVTRGILDHATTGRLSQLPPETTDALVFVAFPTRPGPVKRLRVTPASEGTLVRWSRPGPRGRDQLSYRWRIERRSGSTQWSRTTLRRVQLDTVRGRVVVQPMNSDFRGPATSLSLRTGDD